MVHIINLGLITQATSSSGHIKSDKNALMFLKPPINITKTSQHSVFSTQYENKKRTIFNSPSIISPTKEF